MIVSANGAVATWRLTIARAIAWSLLLAGWVGLGAIALDLTPDLVVVFALIAFWLVALGVAATIATRDTLRPRSRRLALVLCAGVTTAALTASIHDGGIPTLCVALLGWAALTALASGVVRSVRLAQPSRPAPPIAAASLGAVAAAIAIGDIGDAKSLALRLGVLVLLAAVTLSLLQISDRRGIATSHCRAGLFDCSLPAWPAGAWHQPQQWPALLAGLAMLPMMAALPLMAAWCRTQSIAPQEMVALHFAAMFAPALLVRQSIGHWSPRALSLVCAGLLVAGAAAVSWASAPFDMLGVALTHGAAWSLAWTGQLWAPERRSRQGTSPLRAALGYGIITMIVGLVVAHQGPAGLAFVQATLGLLALFACIYGLTTHGHAATG